MDWWVLSVYLSVCLSIRLYVCLFPFMSVYSVCKIKIKWLNFEIWCSPSTENTCFCTENTCFCVMVSLHVHMISIVINTFDVYSHGFYQCISSGFPDSYQSMFLWFPSFYFFSGFPASVLHVTGKWWRASLYGCLSPHHATSWCITMYSVCACHWGHSSAYWRRRG